MKGIRVCHFCKQEILPHERSDVDNIKRGAYTVWHFAHERCADKIIVDNFRFLMVYLKHIFARFKK